MQRSTYETVPLQQVVMNKPILEPSQLASKSVRKGPDLRSRIRVLKPGEVSGTRILHLKSDLLASGTRECRDNKRVTGRDSDIADIVRDSGRVVEGSRARSRLGQPREIDLTVTAKGKGRGLEIGLLGEQEDKAAGFAFVRLGDIEVEDARDGWGHLAVELGAEGLVGSLGINGNDQVREFKVA